MRRRQLRSAIAAAAALAAIDGATAQDVSVYAGVASRAEYNDNYFFTAPGQPVAGSATATPDKESAFTLSVIPFVAVSRRTEVSEVTALASVGANKVWGPSPSEEYLSGSFVLNGALRQERSTWAGRASYSRSPQLQDVVRDTNVVLALTYTDAALVEGSYNYAMSERLTLGATVGGFANRYDSVQGVDNLSDDRGYSAGGNARYAFSDQTQLSYSLGYSYYSSDLSKSDVITTSLGVVHRYSPQLTVSASIGQFWSDSTAKQNIAGQGGIITAGEDRSANGTLLGGSVSYAVSEFTQVSATVSQNLAPSGVGALSKAENAGLALVHRFSERMTGRAGASYSVNSFPAAIESSDTDTTLRGQVGLSYRIAEHWMLDAGYQYTRTKYSGTSSEPTSNIVFVSVGYNWPGESITGWVGRPMETQGLLPGAGPVSLPERGIGSPRAPSTTSSDPAPFGTFTLP